MVVELLYSRTRMGNSSDCRNFRVIYFSASSLNNFVHNLFGAVHTINDCNVSNLVTGQWLMKSSQLHSFGVEMGILYIGAHLLIYCRLSCNIGIREVLYYTITVGQTQVICCET
jgi:hypothetical protein